MTSAAGVTTVPRCRLRRSALAAAMLVSTMGSFAPSLAAGAGGRLYAGVGLAVTDYENAYQQVPYRDEPFGAELFGGVQLRDRVGVELAVTKLGAIRSGDVLGSGVAVLNISADYRAITVRGVFSLQLADVLPALKRWTVYATGGGYSSMERRRVVDIVSSKTAEDSFGDAGLALGTGALYRFSRFSLRTGVEWCEGSYAGHSSVQVATQYRF